MSITRMLAVAAATVAVAVPSTPASAEPGIIARAFAHWNGASCTSLTDTCTGSPKGEHYSLVGPLNLGGSGFLYVNGVLVDNCTFGPGGSCNTQGGSYSWAWDNNGVGCYTATAVTILIGGDIDQDTSTGFGC